MVDEQVNDHCTSCGRRFEVEHLFCARCGAARSGGGEDAAPTGDEPSYEHTTRRERLRDFSDPMTAVVEPDETILSATVAGAVLPPVPDVAAATPPAPPPPAPPPAAPPWAAMPPGPFAGGPSSGRRVPDAIRVVAGALVAIAALLLYPVFRWGGSLLADLFSGGLLGFSFAVLALYVLVILAMMGTALIALAVGLWRGSRVSQGITIILAASIGLAELIQAPKNAGGSGQPAAIAYLISLGCVLIIVALVVPEPVRRFLADHDDGPLGIGIARTICVYFGWVLAVDGVLIMMIGAAGKQYIFWGIGFFIVAALLLWSQVLLVRGGQSGAVLATMMFGVYVVIQLSFIGSVHEPVDASTVIGICVAACAIGALWLPVSSRDFYSALGSDAAAWERPALASGVAFAVLLAMGIGGCIVGSVAASKISSGLDTLSSSDVPQSDYPTDTPTDNTYPTDSPTDDPYAGDTPTPTWSPEASFTNQWSATATASDGYSEEITVATGAPERFTDGMMNGRVTAGSACTIDPNTDAVVPAKVTVTNTSPGDFSSYPAVNIGFGYDWSNPAAEVGYSDGDQCQTSQFNINWTDSVASGTSVATDIYFVISNYYTPAHPDGDPAALASAQVDLTAATNSTDDLTYTPGTPTGPGVEQDSGFFPIAPN